MNFKKQLFLLLIVSFMILPMVSAVWWNPFTWFDDTNANTIKDGGWYLSHLSGIQLEYFNTEIQNLDNGKAKICLLPKTNLRINDDVIVQSKAIIKKDNIETRIIEPSDMEVETESGYIKKMCVDIDIINEDEIKFGENSALFFYTNESIIAIEDGINIGRLSLTTEDFEYKNGRPNIQTSRGIDKLTHTFYIEDYSNNAITNLRTINMKTNEEVDRNVNLKYLSYIETQEDTYDTICEDIINETNVTEICNKFINGSITVLKEQWNDMNLAIDGEDYLVGIFSDILKNDYIDVDFDYYGNSVLASPIYWATWTEDLNTNLNAYWTFNETSGNLIDLTGQGNDGTPTGVTYSATGIIETAYDFGGNPDFVDVGNATGIIDMSVGSLSVWFYADTTTNDNFIFSHVSGSNDRFIIYAPSPETYEFLLGNGVCGSSLSISNSAWHNIIASWDGTNCKVYLDGVLKETDVYSYIQPANNDFQIGRAEDSSNRWWDGRIDEFAIWGRELDDDSCSDEATCGGEIADLYNSGVGIKYTDVFGTAPSVTLTSPANGANLTSANVDMIATITDDQYVENVTLYLDGVANETKTTHVNGSYTFTKIVSEGVHNWSILAYDNQSLSNQSDTWTYNYLYSCLFEGYIFDQSGNPLEDSNITIWNQFDTSEYYSNTSDSNGYWSYLIPNGTNTYMAGAYYNSSLVGKLKTYILGIC